MADPGASQSKSPLFSHVTIMAALLVISLGTFVQCDKKEVPSSPGSSFEFDDIDADRSGCVEGPEELQNFRIQVGRILGEALQLDKIERALRAGRITHSADINGDGRICQCDLLSILLTESTGPGVHRHAFRVYEDGSFFDDVDANGDGVLDDVTEREAMTQKLAQCVPVDQARTVVEAMSKLDKDDGKLTRAEYLLFLESAQHQSESLSDKSSSSSMPQSVPPQPQQQLSPQSPSQPQSQPSAENAAETPKQEPQTETNQKETPQEREQGRPRKRLLPQPFPLNPAPQPALPPQQPWNHQPPPPQPPHYQLMREASRRPHKAFANSASQPLNQPAHPTNAVEQDEQNLRSVVPRHPLVNAKRLMTRFRSQQIPVAARAQPQVQQQQQYPQRLENFYPNLHPRLQPALTLNKLERAGVRGQPYLPQPQAAASQPAQSLLPQRGLKLESDSLNGQTIASNPSQAESQPESQKPPASEVKQEMKNLSRKEEDVKSKPEVPPTVDKNLESELQDHKN